MIDEVPEERKKKMTRGLWLVPWELKFSWTSPRCHSFCARTAYYLLAGRSRMGGVFSRRDGISGSASCIRFIFVSNFTFSVGGIWLGIWSTAVYIGKLFFFVFFSLWGVGRVTQGNVLEGQQSLI